MKLFDEMPVIENEHILLREITAEDAERIASLARNPEVYRYLPTFLFEQKYSDAGYMISRIREECFDTKESILLGICLKEDPGTVIGIAEYYNYDEEREKASIGYRLDQPYWGRGIATETAALLKKYLLEKTDVRKITAYVMKGNKASASVLEKNGFVCEWPDLSEDWGRGEPVTADKNIYRKYPKGTYRKHPGKQ